jgi:hypothetical protein
MLIHARGARYKSKLHSHITPREIFVYAGQVQVGLILIMGGQFEALAADGVSLGAFPTQRSAYRALVDARAVA